MQIYIYLSIFLLLGATFVSRYMTDGALKLLDDKQKARLSETFSKYRLYNFGPLIIGIILYLGISQLFPQYLKATLIGFFLYLVAFIIIFQIFIFQQLSKLDLPQAYVQKFVLANAIRYVALAVFLGFVISNLFLGLTV